LKDHFRVNPRKRGSKLKLEHANNQSVEELEENRKRMRELKERLEK
jgi:hypothetical protein